MNMLTNAQAIKAVETDLEQTDCKQRMILVSVMYLVFCYVLVDASNMFHE